MDEPSLLTARAGERPTNARYVVLTWFCVSMALAYMSRNAISVAESTIRKDLGITMDESGWLLGVFFLPYALFQIPAAQYGRHTGARWALPIFSIAWSVATAATAFVSGLWTFVVTRAAQGIAQAGLIPTSTASVSKWFPKAGMGFATGALGSFMSVGSALGAALTGWMLESFLPYTGPGRNWRLMFLVLTVPGIVWAIAFHVWFRDEPGEHKDVNEAELELIRVGKSAETVPREPGGDGSTPWLALFTSPPLWWISGQQFFRAAGYMFFTSWFATYLQEARHLSIPKSGLYTSLPLLAVVAGGVLGGMLSDWLLVRTGSRRIARQGMGAACMFLCALLIFWAMTIGNAFAAVLVISLGSLLAAMGGPCAFAITIDMGGSRVAPINATMNMMGNLGALAFAVEVPRLVKRFGNWDSVLLVFGGCYIAATLFWLLLKPEGTILEQALVRERNDG